MIFIVSATINLTFSLHNGIILLNFYSLLIFLAFDLFLFNIFEFSTLFLIIYSSAIILLFVYSILFIIPFDYSVSILYRWQGHNVILIFDACKIIAVGLMMIVFLRFLNVRFLMHSSVIMLTPILNYVPLSLSFFFTYSVCSAHTIYSYFTFFMHAQPHAFFLLHFLAIDLQDRVLYLFSHSLFFAANKSFINYNVTIDLSFVESVSILVFDNFLLLFILFLLLSTLINLFNL